MEKIISFLKKMKGKTLLLTHHNADIDAISSITSLFLGLKQLGKRCDMGVSESVSKSARKISEGFDIKIDPDCNDYDNVILVETSSSEQLKGVKNPRADVIIDHHPLSDLGKNIILIDEEARSTSQIIYNILKKMDCRIDKKMGEIILAGLVADSAHLSLARLEEFEIVIDILRSGVSYQDVLSILENKSSYSEKIAIIRSLGRLETYAIGDLIISFSSVGSYEAAACRALKKIVCDISIMFNEKDNEVRISSRGRRRILDYGIDLSVIFKKVGKMIDGSGGGHDLAGSANGRKLNKRKIKEFILEIVSEKVGKKFKKI